MANYIDGKAATESLGMISAFIGLIAGVLELFGLTINVEQISGSLNEVIMLASMVGAMYGRKRATQPITSITKKK